MFLRESLNASLDNTILQLTDAPTGIASAAAVAARQPVALGEAADIGSSGAGGDSGGGGGGMSDEDALQARLDALRKG